MMKQHDCCKTCGYLGHRYGWGRFYGGYCEINNEAIEYPRKMGGKDKCPRYIAKAEYRKAYKKKIIENHVYPEKR